VGAPGSFTVLVDGKVVSEKKTFDFPSEGEIVEAVGKALNGKR
jgi:hypothetical protein